MRSPVQNTADNLPYAFYERLADGTVRNITGELPFDVPDSWEWVRLGNLIQLISGQDMTPDKYSTEEIGIPYLTGASNIENQQIIVNRWTATPKTIAEYGDLLITCKGTVGAMAFLTKIEFFSCRAFMYLPPISPQFQQVCGQYRRSGSPAFPGIVVSVHRAAEFLLPRVGTRKGQGCNCGQ